MKKAMQYIINASQSCEDEFSNYIGDIISDHEAFIAIELAELEILESFLTNPPSKEELSIRIKELKKKLKKIIKNNE